MTLASRAKDKGMENVMVLKARKAGRLQDSNIRLQDLYKKMESTLPSFVQNVRKLGRYYSKTYKTR
jgi:hypothetical protein